MYLGDNILYRQKNEIIFNYSNENKKTKNNQLIRSMIHRAVSILTMVSAS